MVTTIPLQSRLGAPRRRNVRAGSRSALLLALGAASCAPAATPAGAQSGAGHLGAAAGVAVNPSEELLYEHGLASAWQDWGWGPHDLSGGTARINFANYGGWILHHEARKARFGALTFRVRAPGSFGDFLELRLANGQADESFPRVAVDAERMSALPDGWVQVSVPWSLLDPSEQVFERIVLHAKTSVASDWVEFDHVLLTGAAAQQSAPASSALSAAATPPPATVAVSAQAPVRTAKVTVECRAKDHAISPYIYGFAGDVWDLGATARRWGGNPTSRYNWQLGNAHNVGKDWFFENTKSPDYRQFLSENAAHHMASALTVPIIGWVAKDTESSGFPRSVFGPQAAEDQYRTGSGNGVRPDGTAIRPGSPTQTSVESPPASLHKWVETIRAHDQNVGERSVHMYILDNEPSLWNSTHRDVHPNPLSYDELLDRTVRYGSVIRAADPQAVIAGPAEWGWTGYLYSAEDVFKGVNLRPDRRAHGDVPLIPWYLKKLREQQQRTGTKILDVLDVHFYPQGNGVYGPAADPQTAALRVRSTRALWDPTYDDESWIKEPIQLIPRLKRWIAENYPGLKLSIGEYNFGGEQDMSGALALAEALGRFGTEGVDYAYYWSAPPRNSPTFWAFRAYRNFDGKDGRFLDNSMQVRADAGVSVFASRDSAGKHLVLVALNLDPHGTAQTKIALNGCSPVVSRRRFSYGAGMQTLGAAAQSEETPTASSNATELNEALAPYSINVFDIVLE